MKKIFEKRVKRFVAVLSCAALMLVVAGCGEKSENSGLTKVEVWSHNSHSKSVMNELVKNWSLD